MSFQMHIEDIKYHFIIGLSFQWYEHFEFVEKVEGVIMLEISPKYINSHDLRSVLSRGYRRDVAGRTE